MSTFRLVWFHSRMYLQNTLKQMINKFVYSFRACTHAMWCNTTKMVTFIPNYGVGYMNQIKHVALNFIQLLTLYLHELKSQSKWSSKYIFLFVSFLFAITCPRLQSLTSFFGLHHPFPRSPKF